MTGLGERLIDWLRSQPDVCMVSDASTDKYGDGIRCSFGGTMWFIALERGLPGQPVADPRGEVYNYD